MTTNMKQTTYADIRDLPPATPVVIEDHTLGYLTGMEGLIGVLHGSPLMGGYNWKNGPVLVASHTPVRKATEEDFDVFRVDTRGYDV